MLSEWRPGVASVNKQQGTVFDKSKEQWYSTIEQTA